MREKPEPDDVPPPVLGRWRNFYILEAVVLVVLIALFVWLGEVYR